MPLDAVLQAIQPGGGAGDGVLKGGAEEEAKPELTKEEKEKAKEERKARARKEYEEAAAREAAESEAAPAEEVSGDAGPSESPIEEAPESPAETTDPEVTAGEAPHAEEHTAEGAAEAAEGIDAAEEAGEIVDQLAALGIPYRISNGGTAILVPETEVQSARLKMAAQGYPRGGVGGYEIFDKSNLGMTDFLQKVNYRRALEGEIAKSIMSLSEVAAARVHLVIPEQRLFARDQKPPTARSSDAAIAIPQAGALFRRGAKGSTFASGAACMAVSLRRSGTGSTGKAA